MSLQWSYIHTPHTTPLEHRMLFQLLDEHASALPDKEAIVFRDEKNNRVSITFKEYKKQSQALAAGLLERGLRRGDQVLILLPSGIEFGVVVMAMDRIGANAIVVEANAAEAITELSGQTDCVVYNDVHDDVIAAVNQVLGEGHLKAAVFVGRSDVDSANGSNRICSYYDLIQECNGQETLLRASEQEVQFDDPAVVIFTSGSTGRPKPIQFTHHGFVNGARTAAHTLEATRDTVLFCDAPSDWINGIGFSQALVPLLGLTLVVFPPNLTVQGHVTGTVLKILEEEKCSRSIFLSYFLLDLTEYLSEASPMDLSRFTFCTTGGQLVDRSLLKGVLDRLPQLTLCLNYGASEMFLATRQVITRGNIDAIDYGAMDVNPGFEAKVVDSEGRLVPVNQQGELYVRAAGIVHDVNSLKLEGLTYKPCKTAAGWYRSKDVAIMNSDGKVRILGRTDNVIKCATSIIQPVEVESVLSKHEYVTCAVAIGVPDQRLYEVVCACVILKACCQGNEEEAIAEIDAWCEDKFFVLSTGMSSKPRHYVVVDKYPTTRTGKTDRRALKKIAMEKLGMPVSK